MKIQAYYIAATRDLQRICSVSRSPIHNIFPDSLNGISTIRAFNKKIDFESELSSLLNGNMKAYFNVLVSNRWLSIRLDSIGVLVITAATFCAVIWRQFFWGPENVIYHASLVGLAIASAMTLSQVFSPLSFEREFFPFL